MTAFIPNIPQSGDFLDTTSQPQLLSNNMALDARFGVDHYEFSDATGQSGKHNRVTTPIYITEPVPNGLPPVVIATEPVIAAFQQTAPFGVLQYSYGWNVAGNVQQAPSPITFIQSQPTGITIAANGTSNVMDFAGLPRAIAIFNGSSFTNQGSMTNSTLLAQQVIFWNGTVFNAQAPVAGVIKLQTAGSVLRIVNLTVNPVNDIYWTMQMMRMQ